MNQQLQEEALEGTLRWIPAEQFHRESQGVYGIPRDRAWTYAYRFQGTTYACSEGFAHGLISFYKALKGNFREALELTKKEYPEG